jgi:hypothetical protein
LLYELVNEDGRQRTIFMAGGRVEALSWVMDGVTLYRNFWKVIMVWQFEVFD